MDKPKHITVTLVYSPEPRKIVETTLVLPQGSTVLDALQAGDLVSETLKTDDAVGIWGKKTKPSHVLQNLDRVEIYRPLKVDPKVARRERFQKQGARTTGLFAKTRVGGKAGY